MSLFIKGFSMAFALFATIGAQNTFVLKQGLMKNHILLVCLICIMCDVLFVSLGVFGVSSFVSENIIISLILGISGFLFVFIYGILSIRSALKANDILYISMNDNIDSRLGVSIKTLLVTLLNPSVYIDTIVILGAVSLSFSDIEKILFASGIIMASCIWFLVISFAANKASALFRNPKTWIALHIFTAIVMFYIAYDMYTFVDELSLTIFD